MPPETDHGAIGQSIPERFEAHARANGDRLAIQWPSGRYRYADLNAAANRLAHAILARRAASSEPIALLFDHGGDVIAAMLAVLKAARCYVVFDPNYPRERLIYMLNDSGARVIVASATNVELARALAGDRAEVIAFDSADAARYSDANPGNYARPEDLALLIYTSGSTGEPKAVMHSHQNVLVDVRNYAHGWSTTPADRWLLATSMGFAHSVRSVYGALLTGAGLYPFDPKRGGFDALAAWVRDHAITLMRVLPTYFRNFAAALPPDAVLSSVRVLGLGGEPMIPADVAAFNRHFSPDCTLVHAFGPTECLTVAWAMLPHGTTISGSRVPIGRPLPDKQVTLVDEARGEAVDGEVGEIAVTSRYLALGYWRAPDRTAAAFRGSPAADERTYFTGDLARRDADGVLWHVGRRDFQVKIRGFRVDVTEVENALRRVPGIADVVVAGRPNALGEQRLVAYFVPASTPAVTGRVIREQLACVVPDHLVPSTYVALDALPLTPHGKIDRLRLPTPAVDADDRDASARTELEAELIRMCTRVLGVASVNLDDGWLDVGGDSLQATRVESAVAAQLGVTLPPGTVLTVRSLRVLADLVSDRRAGATIPLRL